MNLITGRTLSAGTTSDLTATRIDISANNWSTITLEATQTNGSPGPYLGRQIYVNFNFSNTDLGATPAISAVKSGASYLKISTSYIAGGTKVTDSIPNVFAGTYIYIWVSCDELGQPVTLDVTATGISSGGSGLVQSIVAGSNYRFKNGQIQFWDDSSYALDNTKPWRALGVAGGITIWSDPILD